MSETDYPVLVFVGRESDGDDAYLVACSEPSELSVSDGERTVAVYRFEKVVTIRNSTEIIE